MELGLQGRTALVTGATSGIGEAIAASLCREGVSVAIVGRDPARVEAAVERLAADTGARPVGFACDIADAASASNLISRLGDWKPVDILVNNAGQFPTGTLYDVSDERWLELFTVNVLGAVRLTRALLPDMLERGWGRVIFIGSEQSVLPDPGMIDYAASKAALLSVARSVAGMTRGTGVTANSVLVGPTWTEGAARFYEDGGFSAEDLEASMAKDYFGGDGRHSLIQRFLRPQEIASYVAFLCSEAAGGVNGAACRVEGGLVPTMV